MPESSAIDEVKTIAPPSLISGMRRWVVKKAPLVDVELAVVGRFSDLVERFQLRHAGVHVQEIDLAELLRHFRAEHSDVVHAGNIGPDRMDAAAKRLTGVREVLFIAPRDQDLGVAVGQRLCHRQSHSMRAADDNGLLALKSAHDSSSPGAKGAAVCRFETVGSGRLLPRENCPSGSLAAGLLAACSGVLAES